jgi:glutamyl-tRNA synthetase
MQVRTRFAPSPTGMLHIGSARTALFSWLYARHHNGKFILRIEDTDTERSTQEAVDAILDGMKWLGLNWDEGPIHQMQRMHRYQEVLQELLDSGKAYRCYCPKARLDDLREKQMANKEKPRYDGLCYRKTPTDPNQPFVIRFKNPESGVVSFEDQVHGIINFQNNELDDLIIARSDGTPTYNFAVVVDDFDMKITHVIRGDDHINNTPRQINLLQALGANIPVYAHLPMILGPDGTKLSKRHGAVNVTQYRDDGFLPEAMLNYLVRLGWSHGDQEIFSINNMIDLFDIKQVNKASAALNPTKLLWINQQHIKASDPLYISQHLQYFMDNQKNDTKLGPDLANIVKVLAERCHTLKEMAEKSRYFYMDIAYDENAKKYFTPEIFPILAELRAQLTNLDIWNKEAIHQILVNTAEKFEIKLGKIAQPLRIIVTGGDVSPPIDITVELIGKAKALQRIEEAILLCSSK